MHTGGDYLSYEVNQRIKEVRQNLNLSQREFGERLGVSRGVLNNIESNVVEAKPLFIQHICTVYGVDPFWLETGEGEMFQKPSEAERFAKLAAKIQSDPNEFKKRVFYALSLMSDEGWAAFEQAWNESEKKEKDTE
jgi:transcriptional regulator with XRE-family HTH domain